MTSAEDQKVVEDDTSTVKLPAQRRSPEGSAAPGPAERRGHRRWIAGGVALALILAATAGAGAYTLRGDVPRGVTVLGLDLGGKSRAQATQALQDHLAARSTTPVPVQADGRTGTIRPQDVSLEADIAATVDAATRGRPALFGHRDVAVVSRVDAQRLDAALRRALAGADQQPRMPAITFTGTTPTAVHPAAGRGLDAERSAHALRDGWLTGRPVTVPLAETQPATTSADVDRLLATLARPAVAAPVTVTTARGTLTIAPAAIARSLILAADRSGLITPRIDDKKLRAALATQLRTVEKTPVDARFAFAAGRPRIVADVPGDALDLAALGSQLLTVLPRSNGRTVAADLRPATPKATAAQLATLGVTARVSTFTTKFPGGLRSPRSQNIVQIAKEVDGALVLPGTVFSLNGHTGERSYAQGYKDAPVILDGKLTAGVGGGASQFTTTLFNAAYYAGLQDVEHKPHSYYFSRYPPGHRIHDLLPRPRSQVQEQHPVRGPARHLPHQQHDHGLGVEHQGLRQGHHRVGATPQHHQPAGDHPRSRAEVHRHRRHQRLHPGRVPPLPHRRQSRQTGEVHLDVRRGTTLRLRPEVLRRNGRLV